MVDNISLKQKAAAAAEKLAEATLIKPVDVAGTVIGEIINSTGNIAITTGKIAEEVTESLKGNTGKITKNAFEALNNVAIAADKLTGTINVFLERVKNGLEAANKRRDEINKLELKKTELNGTQVLEKLNYDLEIKKQKLEVDLLRKKQEYEQEKIKIENQALKLEKQFENAQLIQEKKDNDEKNLFYMIAKDFTYKDYNCKELGFETRYVLSLERYKKFCYIINGIIDPKTKNILQVKFNKSENPEEKNKEGYYTIMNEYVYKLAIIPKIIYRDAYFSDKKIIKTLPSIATITRVDYIPKCFEGNIINLKIQPVNDDEKNIQNDEYPLITKLVQFNMPIKKNGGKRTRAKRRNNKTRNKRNKITRKNK